MRIALNAEWQQRTKYLKNHSNDACQQDDEEEFVPIIRACLEVDAPVPTEDKMSPDDREK
jgi:hypothetical protein